MKSIFFDLDGTLVDSSKGIRASFAHTFNTLGQEMPDPETITSFIGPPLEMSFSSVLEPDQVSSAIQCYRQYFLSEGIDQVEIYQGILPLLENLNQVGYDLYITTSKNEPTTLQLVENLALTPYFTGIFGSLPQAFHKADVIRRALKEHPVDLDQAVIIGDTKFDMIGGKKVGIKTLGALWGFGSKEDLVAHGADALAETPQDVEPLLRRL